MKRDPLFFQFFRDLPGCFFRLVGRPAADAGRYKLDAIEYKATAVRLDGVFRPLDPAAGPAYLWEAQFHPSDRVYANLMAKAGLFLQREDPGQDWVGVVIYPTRALEPKNLHPYRWLIGSDQLVRIYLDELPAAGPDQFDLGILQLIAAKPEAALDRAMIPRVRASDLPADLRRHLLQFIETVIVFQFPGWHRAEIEKMIQTTDMSQTRVFQEGVEEGVEKGRKEGVEKGRREGVEEGLQKGRVAAVEAVEGVARRLLELGRPVAEVATATKLTAAQIRKLAKKPPK